MPRIRCHYEDCIFLEEGYCGAAAVELDPDQGCLTYSSVEAVAPSEVGSEWDVDEFDEEWDDDEVLYEDEEESEDDSANDEEEADN